LSSSITEPSVSNADLVDHGRRGDDQIEVVLALEPFLHDLHVQHAEEAAAEAEAQRRRSPARTAAPSRSAELVQRLAEDPGNRWKSTGNTPAKTRGCTGWKPGRGFSAASREFVSVSPTGAPWISLMPAK
jgi:hypothetical protein